MKRGAIIAFLFGLALFIGIVVWEGADSIFNALAVAGWGMLVVAAWHLVPLIFDSIAQWYALPWRPGAMPHASTTLRARWIGESVNSLLPVAQMGGLFVMVRVLAQRGYPGAAAGAGVTVGATQQMLAQVVFAIIGLLLLSNYAGGSALLWGLVAGVAVLSAMGGWLYYVQRRGMFEGVVRLVRKTFNGRNWLKLSGGAQALDAAVHDIYRDGARVRRSFAYYLLGWVVGCGEVWISLYVLGHPVTIVDALFLESLAQAIIGIAFVIPGALGVQEGGYVLLCGVVGVPADTAIALSLIRRVRQLALGIPGLVSWQVFEGRKLTDSAAQESIATHPAAMPDAPSPKPSSSPDSLP